jgi:predicted amidophosphoribosyltransferase
MITFVWHVLLIASPFIVTTALYLVLVLPLLRQCKACRLSMPRTATRCPHCTTPVTKKAAP